MANIDAAFKAYDIRGLYGEQVDEDLAWRVGHAASQFLRSSLSGYDRGQQAINKIIVGRDMRPHSQSLSDAMIEGISSSGVTAIDVGMCDTPMIYFAVNHLGTCGGIQITASHNPIEYNGFKISGFKARPVSGGSGLKEIQRLVHTINRMPPTAALTESRKVNLWAEYRGHVHKFLDLERKVRVVADASNGMAGKMLPEIFSEVDKLELIPLNFELEGNFVHPPNPLVEANLKWVKEGVLDHGADLGICLDGDADRCMFVDETGRTVRCDIMSALLAREFLKENKGSTVVYDLRSSRALVEVIRESGGVPRRERVGHSFIKKAMADTHAVFGGELSGHSYFRDNFHADSGAIAFASAVSMLSRSDVPLSRLAGPIESRYCHSGEINFEVEDKEGVMRQVEELFSREGAETDRLDGVTCHFRDWWLNLRPSNTEPLLRLSLETDSREKMEEKLEFLKQILGEPVDH